LEPRALTCEQCGAPYLEGVTICYSCGAPIGEAEQPTRPVKVPVHLRARVATVPSAAAGGVPAGQGPAGGASASDGEPEPQPGALLWPPRARPLTLWLLGLTVLVLVAGIVVLRYRLVPPGVPARSVYRDPGRRFHFVQPALWHAAPMDGGVRLVDDTGSSTAEVVVTWPGLDANAANSADSIAENLGIASPATAHFAGVTWEQRSGQVLGNDGVRRQVVVLTTLHDGQLYIIELASPAGSFAATESLVFQPLLRSFAFG
jgi:hypothetical protein